MHNFTNARRSTRKVKYWCDHHCQKHCDGRTCEHNSHYTFGMEHGVPSPDGNDHPFRGDSDKTFADGHVASFADHDHHNNTLRSDETNHETEKLKNTILDMAHKNHSLPDLDSPTETSHFYQDSGPTSPKYNSATPSGNFNTDPMGRPLEPAYAPADTMGYPPGHAMGYPPVFARGHARGRTDTYAYAPAYSTGYPPVLPRGHVHGHVHGHVDANAYAYAPAYPPPLTLRGFPMAYAPAFSRPASPPNTEAATFDTRSRTPQSTVDSLNPRAPSFTPQSTASSLNPRAPCFVPRAARDTPISRTSPEAQY